MPCRVTRSAADLQFGRDRVARELVRGLVVVLEEIGAPTIGTALSVAFGHHALLPVGRVPPAIGGIDR